MKKFLFSLAVLALPASAFAAGIDLTWNDCVTGGLAATNKNFVCTGTANQNYSLFFCFKSPVTLTSFVAINIYTDWQNLTPGPLAPFWHYETGGCQGGTVKGVAIFNNIGLAPQCTTAGFSDPWDGDGTGGVPAIAAYGADVPTPGKSRMIMGVARSGSPTEVTVDVNYYAAHLVYNNRNKTACAGCTQTEANVWNTCTLESNNGDPTVALFTSDKGGPFVCGRINGADDNLCAATATRNTTWGAVKALYR